MNIVATPEGFHLVFDNDDDLKWVAGRLQAMSEKEAVGRRTFFIGFGNAPDVSDAEFRKELKTRQVESFNSVIKNQIPSQ